MLSRSKQLVLNSMTSLLFQFIALICGFIVPRLILKYYGSEVNGLVSSITQFIGVINFFDLGVTSVITYNLFKPLAVKDYEGVSCIVTAADKFFNKIGLILIIYLSVLSIAYPLFSRSIFDFWFIFTLIMAMGINAFGQYYLGVVNRIILLADQKNYIAYTIQIITLILNTVLNIIIIKSGGSIQLVKLITSLVYILRPVCYSIYVRKYFKINRNISYSGEPLQQKWNGVAQHVCAVILDSTDTIILTIFSTLSNVSIYNIYFMIVNGIRGFFMSITNGFNSLMGDMWTKNEVDKLKELFIAYEWFTINITLLVFGCTGSLIVKFVDVYTKGISDADYHQPLFGILITFAAAIYCLRVPYNTLVLAIGKYKETQKSYINAVILNIAISVIAVKRFGLIGVTLGTIISLLYQSFWMNLYISKKILRLSMLRMIKYINECGVVIIFASLIINFINIDVINYYRFIITGFINIGVWGSSIFLINLLSNKGKLKWIKNVIVYRILNK